MRIDARRKNIIFAVGIRHTKNHNTLFMAEYIFYTTDGFTQAPDGNDIENGQLLGCAYGNNKDDALDNLLMENPWIKKRGFDTSNIIGRELVSRTNIETKLTFLTNLLNEHQLEEYTNWLKSIE